MTRFAPLLVLALLSAASDAQPYATLGGWDAQGVPDYLVAPDVIDDALLDVVATSLPESISVPDGHPEFLTEGTELDLRLTEEADVWVTFVLEGAGYRNALGFYTYDLADPPQTVGEIGAHTLIFPNVSAQYSGGGLQPGDKVHLGRFPAGTGIGWFLVANGWNSRDQRVGSGRHTVYSRPDFNPESDPALQQHSVLLRDDARQILLLGLEDLRRDQYSDEDFNDAVFYVTANPYTAVDLGEVAVVDDPGTTTGGNDGGLESNGDVAEALAVRMFERSLAPEARPAPFSARRGGASGAGKLASYDVLSLIPESGPLGSAAYVTTPGDLVGLTNATAVFAGDYVRSDGSRLAALFAATTPAGDTYDHTKVICDRLRGATLETVRHVRLKGRPFVLSVLRHPDGSLDQAISFVAYRTDAGWTVDSRYLRGEYRPPASGDEVLNIQVWASSPTYSIQLATAILDEMEADGPLAFANEEAPLLPDVVVRTGTYRHGALHLRVANPIGATTLTVEGRGARTESGQTELVSQTVALPADEEVDVVVPVGTLFDAVFSVSHNASDRQDQLYLADGAWGATADPASGVVTAFDTTPEAREPDAAQWTVERGVRVEGETATWATVFRYLTPGGGPVDLTAYDAIALTVSGSGRPVLRLGKASINGWDQFGARLDLTPEARRVVIPFSDLRLSDGTPGFIAEDVRLLTVAFSGQGGASAPFSLTLTDIAFVSAAATSGEAPAAPTEAMEVSPVHPNPTASDAAVTLALAAGADVTVEVVDVLGRVVAVAHDGPLAAGRHRVALPTDGLAAGSYLCRIRSADGQVVRPMVRAR